MIEVPRVKKGSVVVVQSGPIKVIIKLTRETKLGTGNYR